jgi:hypothetical protein
LFDYASNEPKVREAIRELETIFPAPEKPVKKEPKKN